ncbi:Matrilin, coiled-coil trimerization domain-containing protein, partial [Cynara cardunculus var. scolymus]
STDLCNDHHVWLPIGRLNHTTRKNKSSSSSPIPLKWHREIKITDVRMARAGGITNAVNVGIAVQADWENREFISHISLNVRQLFDFLVQFEATTKSKLASLNEKLDTLERRLEMLEVQVGTATANPNLFKT